MEKTLESFVKTADWKNEKHVPVIDAPASVKAGETFDVDVTVGKEIPHPNTVEHHIAWIALHYVPEGAQLSPRRRPSSAWRCRRAVRSMRRRTATCTDSGRPPPQSP